MITEKVTVDWLSLEDAYGLDLRMVHYIDEDGVETDYLGIKSFGEDGQRLLQLDVMQKWLEENGFSLRRGWYLADPDVVDFDRMALFFDLHKEIQIENSALFIEVSERVDQIHAFLQQLKAEKQLDDRVAASSEVNSALNSGATSESAISVDPVALTSDISFDQIEHAVGDESISYEQIIADVNSYLNVRLDPTASTDGDKASIANIGEIKRCLFKRFGADQFDSEMQNLLDMSTLTLSLSTVLPNVQEDNSKYQELRRAWHSLPTDISKTYLVHHFQGELRAVCAKLSEEVLNADVPGARGYSAYLKNYSEKEVYVPDVFVSDFVAIDALDIPSLPFSVVGKYVLTDFAMESHFAGIDAGLEPLFEKYNDLRGDTTESASALRSLIMLNLAISDGNSGLAMIREFDDHRALSEDLHQLDDAAKDIDTALGRLIGLGDIESVAADRVVSDLSERVDRFLAIADDIDHERDLEPFSADSKRVSMLLTGLEDMVAYVGDYVQSNQSVIEVMAESERAGSIADAFAPAVNDIVPDVEPAYLEEIETPEPETVVVSENARTEVDGNAAARGLAISRMNPEELQELVNLSYNLMLESFSNDEVAVDLRQRCRSLFESSYAALTHELSDTAQMRLTEIVYNLSGVIAHLDARPLILVDDRNELEPIRNEYRALNDAVDGTPLAGVDEMLRVANATEAGIHLFDEEYCPALLAYAEGLKVRNELLTRGQMLTIGELQQALGVPQRDNAEIEWRPDTPLLDGDLVDADRDVLDVAEIELANGADVLDVQDRVDDERDHEHEHEAIRFGDADNFNDYLRAIYGENTEFDIREGANGYFGCFHGDDLVGVLENEHGYALLTEDVIADINDEGRFLMFEGEEGFSVEDDVYLRLRGLLEQEADVEIDEIDADEVLADINARLFDEPAAAQPDLDQSIAELANDVGDGEKPEVVLELRNEVLETGDVVERVDADITHDPEKVLNVDSVPRNVSDSFPLPGNHLELANHLEVALDSAIKLFAYESDPLSYPPLSIKEKAALAFLPLGKDLRPGMHSELFGRHSRIFKLLTEAENRHPEHITKIFRDYVGQLSASSFGNTRTVSRAHSDALLSVLEHVLPENGPDSKLRVMVPVGGNGHLLSRIPTDLRDKLDITVVEEGELMAKVIKMLNPDVTVINRPLPEAGLEKGQKFDVVFGDTTVSTTNVDHVGSQGHTQRGSEYIFAHGNEMLKPGGKLILSLPQRVLDNVHPIHLEDKHQKAEVNKRAFRGMISGSSHLLGAVRLADNQVGTLSNAVQMDIVALQRKTLSDANEKTEDWTSTVKVSLPMTGVVETNVEPEAIFTENTDQHEAFYNEYFVNNPERILGTPYVGMSGRIISGLSVYESIHRPFDQTVINNVKELFSPAIIPESSAEAAVKLKIKAPNVYELDGVELKDWTYVGAPMVVENALGVETVGRITKIEADENALAGKVMVTVDEATPGALAIRQLDFVKLGNCVRECIEAQSLEEGETENVVATRAALNNAYDVYRERHGMLHSKETHKARQIDPASGQVLAVEYYKRNPETKEVEVRKNPIFTERVVAAERDLEDVDSVQEALVISMGKYGDVKPEYIAHIMGKPWEECLPEIDDHIFLDPKQGKYILSDIYLSGDVRSKLEEAKYARELAPGFQKNVDALELVQPEPLKEDRMVFTLGADYMEPEIIQAFLKHHFKQESHSSEFILGRDAKGDWECQYKTRSSSDKTRMEKLTSGDYIGVDRFLTDLINQKLSDAPVKAKEKLTPEQVINRTEAIRATQASSRQSFDRWLRQNDDVREKLVSKFNEAHNRFVEPKWDGSKLLLRGLSKEIKPYSTQLNAAFRSLLQGSMVEAAEPGSGKTIFSAILAMAYKQYRNESTLIAAKLSTLGKYEKEMYAAFPSARVFVLNNERARPENRAESIELINHGNYDFILSTHNVLERMVLSEGATNAVYTKKITDARAAFLTETRSNAGGGRILTAERAIEADRTKMLAKFSDKHRPICFDELKVDNLILDENQYFKNFPYYTKHKGISGLHLSPSQRATKLWAFSDYLRMKHQGERGSVYMSGTPIATSLIEAFTIIQANRPGELKAAGIHTLDQFIKVFCEIRGESAPDGRGGVKTVTKIKFHNGEALMRLSRTVFDFVTAEDANIERPDLVTNLNVVKKTMAQRCDDKEIRARIDRMEAEKVDPSEDNVLVQRTHMALAAVDTRLRYPEAYGDNKMMAIVAQTLEYYHASTPIKGAQVIFLDVGVPNSKAGKFDLYNDAIKYELVRAGIPEDEIVFSQDAGGDTDKLEENIHALVRTGKKRVYIAHKEQAGVGSEFQDRLVAVHLANIDQRPDEMEQKVKRGHRVRPSELRHLFPKINVEVYVTENSEDSMRLDRLNDRASSLKLFLSGSSAFDTLDEEGESSLLQMKQCVWGEIPEFKDRNDREIELRTLKAQMDSHEDERRRSVKMRGTALDTIENSEKAIETMKDMFKVIDEYHSRNMLPDQEEITETSPERAKQVEDQIGAIGGLSRLGINYEIFSQDGGSGDYYYGDSKLGSNFHAVSQAMAKNFEMLESVYSDIRALSKGDDFSESDSTWLSKLSEGVESFISEKRSQLDAEQAQNSSGRINKVERAVSKVVFGLLELDKSVEYTDQVKDWAESFIENKKDIIDAVVAEHVTDKKEPVDLRTNLIVGDLEKQFIASLKHGLIDGIRGNVREVSAASESAVVRNGQAIFTWKGVPVFQLQRQIFGDDPAFAISDVSKEKTVLGRFKTLAGINRVLTPTGLTGNIERATSVIAENKEVLETLAESQADIGGFEDRIIELEAEIKELDSIIARRQAQVLAETEDEPDSIPELMMAIAEGKIEPDTPTLENISERVTRHENIGELRSMQEEQMQNEVNSRLQEESVDRVPNQPEKSQELQNVGPSVAM